MKIVIINRSETQGGAAVACKRLFNALKIYGTQVKLLVQEKKSSDESIISTTNTYFKTKLNFFRLVLEKLFFLFYEKSKEIRFAFSVSNTGENISTHEVVKNADIIHLHWINQGFLSLGSLHKILKLNKPVVWTLHDMWSFTGGCHYAGDCTAFQEKCGMCHFLKNPGINDLSSGILQKKETIYKNADITFVACSQWLANVAKQSSLLSNFNIISIPNPIDTTVYKPISKTECRNALSFPADKKLILFGAANISDKRKGFSYFAEALSVLNKKRPDLQDKIRLVLFGKSTQDVASLLPYEAINLNYLSGDAKIAQLYSSVDMFVLPSLEDNLPNTVMESLACGTPVVAFETGGVPEMIEHKKTGYLAKFKSAEDLAAGIEYILDYAEPEELSRNAVSKVEKEYSQKVVAEKYNALYKSLINK